MNGNHAAAGDWDALLENFAADLTAAAYPIALRHRLGGSWVDLELDLWKVLSATVKNWGRDAGLPADLPGGAEPGQGKRASRRLDVDLEWVSTQPGCSYGSPGRLR